MPNRRLAAEEVERARALLARVQSDLATLAEGDRDLLFAYRRRLIVKLTHDERGTPAARNKLKTLKRLEQKGLCPICNEKLPENYVELDRFNASLGYTRENTRLIHHACHIADQAEKRYL